MSRQVYSYETTADHPGARKGVFPVAYAWLVESAERSIKEGRPVRLSRLSYAAPRPRRADNRSKRHLRMSVPEKEQFARSYAAWLREEISRNEMLEQMHLKFFDGVSTTGTGARAALTGVRPCRLGGLRSTASTRF